VTFSDGTLFSIRGGTFDLNGRELTNGLMDIISNATLMSSRAGGRFVSLNGDALLSNATIAAPLHVRTLAVIGDSEVQSEVRAGNLLRVDNATLTLAPGGLIGAGTHLSLANAASRVQVGNRFLTVAGLSGVAGSQINLGNGSLTQSSDEDGSFEGNFAGAGRFVKEGAGRFILNSPSTHSGGVDVVSGSLGLGLTGASATGSGTVRVFSGGTLGGTGRFGGKLELAGGLSSPKRESPLKSASLMLKLCAFCP
jgi:autotransporter-associated beta strand protein